MIYFDHHIHMSSRTTDDYESMFNAGIRAVIEPAFWQGQPRTHIGSFEDYFMSLVGWEKFRASQFGIHHFCTLGLNPKESNNRHLSAGVIDLLKIYLNKPSVVGVGEIGYDEQTKLETQSIEQQVQLAIDFNLPVLIHTPHRDKKSGTKRTIDLLLSSNISPEKVLIDHNNEETLPMVLDHGFWAGHSIYPNTKMNEQRMVEIVKNYGSKRITINSAADWGVSDPLKVPKTAKAMKEAGIPLETIKTITWDNPIRFFEQSNKMSKIKLENDININQSLLWEDNSVLRGQKPTVVKK